MNTLKPNQIKTLKLFAHYCMGYGASEVYQIQFVEFCDLNYFENNWYQYFGSTIEGYVGIENTIKQIISDYDLLSSGVERDCENNANLRINIDCKEKNISIYIEEFRFSNNEMGTEETDIENEDVQNLFKRMLENRYNQGVVKFDGSGDSGEIYNEITFDGDIVEDLSEGVMNYLFDYLESFYDGWEINEGSDGEFIFHLGGNLVLNFNEHREDEVDLGRIFYAEF